LDSLIQINKTLSMILFSLTVKVIISPYSKFWSNLVC